VNGFGFDYRTAIVSPAPMRHCLILGSLLLSALPAGAQSSPPPVRTLNALSDWLTRPGAGFDVAPVLRRALSRREAEAAVDLVDAARRREVAAAVKRDSKAITIGDRTLRWESRQFGDAPFGKRSLWISMHGGGNAAPAVNDRQWRNQIGLYQPAEGIYLAPRAPTDTWNLWHEPHIDPLFQRLIDAQVAINGIDPDRVYLLGYSAGGDGVWQLAPRMADRFAAAAMMAGHPNEAGVASLRNLPFAIFMGGADSAYDRNKIAAERGAELERLHAADPGGYVSMTRIYPGLPHWMNRKDAEALPWMAQFTRNPWPKRVIWVQDDVTHDRFYWLRIPDAAAARAGDRIDAVVDGQGITLTGKVPAGTTLRLSDRLIDLDRPVQVVVNGERRFAGKVRRTVTPILASFAERLDASSAATASLTLK
jgi:dienelactone hydrolase